MVASLILLGKSGEGACGIILSQENQVNKVAGLDIVTWGWSILNVLGSRLLDDHYNIHKCNSDR